MNEPNAVREAWEREKGRVEINVAQANWVSHYYTIQTAESP